MKREPLFKISYRLRQMKAADQCSYLISCINLEGKDTVRRRELSKQLLDARTRQIQLELKKKRTVTHELP